MLNYLLIIQLILKVNKLINLINEPKEKYKLAAECKYAKIYKREVSIKNQLIIIYNYIFIK